MLEKIGHHPEEEIQLTGLTKIHWEEVLTRGRSYLPPKILDYAAQVLKGNFPEGDFHHRQYLGRRHWLPITDLLVVDTFVIPRRFWGSKKVQKVNPNMLEIVLFAKREAKLSYTLKDYIGSLFSVPNVVWTLDESNDRWVGEKVTYIDPTEGYEVVEQDYENGQYFPASWTETVRVKHDGYSFTDLVYEDKLFYKQWLLEENELPLMIGQTTQLIIPDLNKRLLDLAESYPKKMRQRLIAATPYLAHLHRLSTFGILEKEISK